MSDLVRSLEYAKDQFLLSVLIRGAIHGAGHFGSTLVAISKGPWSVGEDEINALDLPRASWALETVATQNLAVALDTALEAVFPDRLASADRGDRDYFQFVRCLRNAFAHEPYSPTWQLRDPRYRREYTLASDWSVDLTHRHESSVEPSDYRHAGGLIHLVDVGRARIASIVGA